MNTYFYDDLNEFSLAVSKQTLEFEPGKHYYYGLNQDILGRVIEVITGKTFYEFLVENLFNPLEMSNTKFHLTLDDREKFQPLLDNLLNHDPFCVFADFSDYLDAQDRVSSAWKITDEWNHKSLINIARSGFFSSDRSIRDYCTKIWGIPH